MPIHDPEKRATRKERGAYYTDPAVAAALSAWAVRHPGDRVLDPSFGAGVFLEAAVHRLIEIGGTATQVHGVELDSEAFALGARSAAACGVPSDQLAQRDFFAVEAARGFDAVVGNPPYIRFQRFGGEARSRSVARAEEMGVDLSPLASSWAPFLIHSTASLAPGGRLAMLVPNEIGQARYAREVLAFMARAFASVTFVTFTTRLFPHLDQEAVAVLAAGRGEAGGRGGAGGTVGFARASGPDDLHDAAQRAEALDVEDLATGRRTLRFFELAGTARSLYARCEREPDIVRLGDVARVTSGYVTGANAFFHLSIAEAEAQQLPPDARTPAVFRSRALRGLELGMDDWQAAAESGQAGFLLTPGDRLDPATLAYLRTGEAAGVDRGYKTRTRTPWWAVPRVSRPDLLMAAMAADGHGLSVNRARVAAANTLHAVHVADRSGDPGTGPVSSLVIAIAWLTSVSQLSRELEGRVLGGGMLKIEPGEAGRILVPAVRRVEEPEVRAVAGRIDAQLRAGRFDEARREADRYLLAEVLGLAPAEIEQLADAARILRALRKRYPHERA